MRQSDLGPARIQATVLFGLAVGTASLAVSTLASAQQRTIPDSAAAAYVGQAVAVEGTVVNVHATRTETTFLNFGSAYPNQTFTAVIFRSAVNRFPNPQQWEGKRVRVTGQVRLYRGRPEIVLEEQSQLVLAP
jgi:DNA/RNA endonuclease YhcR with UshA esterase domain